MSAVVHLELPFEHTNRKCSKCGGIKSLDEFYRRRGRSQGRSGVCKSCRNAQQREHYASDPGFRAKTLEGNRRRGKIYRADPSGRLARMVAEANRRERYRKSKEYRAARLVANKERRFLRIYGISFSAAVALLRAQGGVCANQGCDRSNRSISFEDGSAVLDHCHATEAIRGVLCRPCNLALGFVKDNRGVLAGLIFYLARSKT